MRSRLLIGLLVLCACTPLDRPAIPEAASLSRAALSVRMNNGTTCRADLVGAAPWAGTMPACALTWRVTLTGADSPVRMAFDALLAAIKAGDLVAPMADIGLIDAAGRSYGFASPVPIDDDDDDDD